MQGGQQEDSKLVGFSTAKAKINRDRREVSDLITQEGVIQVSEENGVQYAGFKFSRALTEEEKCVAVLDWTVSYLNAMKGQIIREGMPAHPESSNEVADFMKYKNSKVEMAPSTTKPD